MRVGARVIRVTAPNPGLMTGSGTHTYLVGDDEVAAIDVGVADEGHLSTVLAAAVGRIRWILVTHGHSDHLPGAFELANRTGALVHGYGSSGRFPGERFIPHRRLRHGDKIHGREWSLTAIYTPGHARDHLCFLLKPEGMLFSGDHIMGGSTVVIAPPDGDMTQYMASLEHLETHELHSIAPGHGEVITDPHGEIARVLAHRRARERAIVSALSDCGPMHIKALVQRLYSNTPVSLHEWAAHSVYAHLLKLRREGVVRGRDRRGRWRCA
jgi:glyoxylase-like metal-dependent hydrolase (beta-lactamase superfamily II)